MVNLTSGELPQRSGLRTFATWLRDNAPLSSEAVARLVALDDGRHPSLTELRFALGLDVNFDTCARAAQDAWPERGQEPTERDFSRVLDAMYRSLSSPRIVHVRITAAGPVLSRLDSPIVIRDEDRLILLPLADNQTGDEVRFSAESHGEGIGGGVEPLRTGSALLDAGPMHQGSYLLPLLITANGKAATIDLPIECRPSGTITIRIIDDATGERVAARVYLADDAGEPWPSGGALRRDRHGAAWFHADGSFTARISGRARLRIVRGIEYGAEELEIPVAPDAAIEREVRLRRWSHMAADGWYSGDVHVHLHYGGEYALLPADAALAQRAEDVNFLNMAVANQNSGWVHDSEHFEGGPSALSDESHILRWGEEYRNNLLGHMCMFGIDELVPPIYSGVPNSDHTYDLPANADAAAHCHTVSGTLSYAHPMLGSSDLDRIFAVAHMVDAKELPVDVAFGHVDAYDLMSYPGNPAATRELWYRLLNCGFHLPATAGTDTFMNQGMQGVVSNPIAGDRAFVRVEGAFTTESWCAGVRAGRTFVTNAPMLALEVEGAQIGDQISARIGDRLHITAEAGSHVPMDCIELVVNGEVVATARAEEEGCHAALLYEHVVVGGCWIALRASGPANPLVLNETLFAHTSPVYVSAPDAPIACAEEAAYFVEWIDRLTSLVQAKGRFPSTVERDAMVALFRTAQAYYRDRL